MDMLIYIYIPKYNMFKFVVLLLSDKLSQNPWGPSTLSFISCPSDPKASSSLPYCYEVENDCRGRENRSEIHQELSEADRKPSVGCGNPTWARTELLQCGQRTVVHTTGRKQSTFLAL